MKYALPNTTRRSPNGELDYVDFIAFVIQVVILIAAFLILQ